MRGPRGRSGIEGASRDRREAAHPALLVGVAFALSLVAGFVDVVGFIALHHVFTAHITGNTVSIGRGIAEHDAGLVLRRGVVIPFFVVAMLASRVVVQAAEQRGRRAPLRLLYGVEALLLAAWLALGDHGIDQVSARHPYAAALVAALPAAAMGIQNAALARFGSIKVRTTHVTGNLARFADDAARWLRWLVGSARRDGLRRALPKSTEQPCFRRATVVMGAWLAYAMGGLAGGLLAVTLGVRALLLPIAALAAVVVIDGARPLSKRPAGRRGEGRGA